ncbi:MAG: hypothetical protein G8237_03175 [Magnetococcales bacterium]|nr:hypothetical protein [Magnetococcales bacterium]NGZ05337.1 hypothetical protein [Magnetococcales bacterium]
MIDLTAPASSSAPDLWTWLFYLLMIGITLWGVYIFLIAPIRKKRHILESIPYCPSLLLPQLPIERDKVIQVASHRLMQLNYRVNLFRLTCTCLRFRRFRQFYPENDIRRLCRHLRKELQNSGCTQQYDELTRGLIASRLRDACYVRETLSRSEMIVGFHPRSSIVRIYTYRKSQIDPQGGPFTGPVDKFTYNHRQDVWVYGEPPPNSEEILMVVDKLITACRARYPSPHKLPQRRGETLPTPIPATEAALAARERRERILSASRSTTPLQKP